jgi:hypothetical protein
MRKPRWNVRLSFVLAMAVLLATTAAVASLHSHEGASSRVCQPCKTAHLAPLLPQLHAGLQPPDPISWHVPALETPSPSDPLPATGPSRAPPA